MTLAVVTLVVLLVAVGLGVAVWLSTRGNTPTQ